MIWSFLNKNRNIKYTSQLNVDFCLYYFYNLVSQGCFLLLFLWLSGSIWSSMRSKLPQRKRIFLRINPYVGYQHKRALAKQ